jgi:hypothetical protein
MRTCIITLLLFLLLPIKGLAQSDKYVVLTFSVKNNIDKIPWEYIWIVPYDSISTESSKLNELTPFAVNGDFEGAPNHPWQSTSLSTSYIWYFKTINDEDNSLSLQMIFNKRKLVQTIRKQWNQRDYRQEIKVYATPIKGKISFCRQKYLSIKYSREYNLYYTENMLEYWNDFWDSPKSNDILGIDYSKIEYNLGAD